MTDYDNPWKETLDVFFADSLELLFPHIHADIDWARGYEFLDKELQKVDPSAAYGKGIVDKLVKVWLKSGQEKWLLLHIEFQAQETGDFPLRMFVYNATIFLLYNQEVVSLAVLGDDRLNWRPSVYRSERWGCRKEFEFPIVKLLDWLPRTDELRTSRNPVAHVVLAHLQALETTREMADRRVRKFELVRNLIKLGLEATTVRKLFRLIDGMMLLPRELETLFFRDVVQIEEEKRMPLLSFIEIWAEERGEKKGRLEGLQIGIESILKGKFGDEGSSLMGEVRTIDSSEKLESFLNSLWKLSTLDEARDLIHGLK